MKLKKGDILFLPILLPLIIYCFLYLEHFYFFNLHTFQIVNTSAKNILLVSSRHSLAEKQESFHNCKALNNLGYNCYIFEYNNSPFLKETFRTYINGIHKAVNYYIEPYFIYYNVPSMLYHNSNYYKYGTLDVGQYTSVMREKKDNPEVKKELEEFKPYTKWLNYFDGLIIYGDNQKWAKSFLSDLKTKHPEMTNNFLYNFFPSVPKTDYTLSERKYLFYSGSNWDDRRGSEHFRRIYKLLDQKDYFAVWGRIENWKFLEKSYKGTINFDQDSLVKAIQSSGIALLFHTDYHIKYGIPSKRVFEAAAASAVILSDRNPFIIREFGDCAFYIDTEKSPEEVVNQIDVIVTHIKQNSITAQEKSLCTHSIFLKKFTLEKQWEKILQMHEDLMLKNEKK